MDAVQRDPANDIAWLRLGMAQAENEKEVPSTASLHIYVQETPRNMDVLMVNNSSYLIFALKHVAISRYRVFVAKRHHLILLHISVLQHARL